MQAMVRIRPCPDYELDRVVALVDQCVGADLESGRLGPLQGKTVLLKPNILAAADPADAVTTRPEIVTAAIRAFASRGARVVIGESPAVRGDRFAAKRCGILQVAEAEGIEWVDFSRSVEVENPQGVRVKRFQVAAPVVEADLVVSLPKLKTHQLLYYTGAMKNLFGTIVGVQKAAFHVRFPERADFAAMITDLCLAVTGAPNLGDPSALPCKSYAIMDGIIAMEGHGPRNGTPRQVGLILSSTNLLALDWVAASVVGYDPRAIPNLCDALGRGHWLSDPREIEVDGPDPVTLAIKDFERVRSVKDGGFGRAQLPPALYRVARNLTVPRPFFIHKKCVRCGECVTICPAKALGFVSIDGQPFKAPAGIKDSLKAKRVSVNYDACVRCYCCDEVCPEDAIVLRRRP